MDTEHQFPKCGHPDNEQNTYTDPHGHQECRMCQRERVRKYRTTQKGKETYKRSKKLAQKKYALKQRIARLKIKLEIYEARLSALGASHA